MKSPRAKKYFLLLLPIATVACLIGGCKNATEPPIDIINSWQKTDLPDSMSVLSLTVTPDGILFAGAYSLEHVFSSGVFRSDDNGVHWQRLADSPPNTFIYFLTTDYHGNVFAGTYQQGIFRSIDKGVHWTQIDTGLIYGSVLSLTARANGDLFAGASDGNDDLLFYSSNSGSRWTQTNLRHHPVTAIIAFGTDNVFAANSVIYHTKDNFVSWESIDSGLTDTNYGYIRSFAMDSHSVFFAT